MLLTEDKFWQLWKGISETMFPEILKYKSSTQDQNRVKNMTHKHTLKVYEFEMELNTKNLLEWGDFGNILGVTPFAPRQILTMISQLWN